MPDRCMWTTFAALQMPRWFEKCLGWSLSDYDHVNDEGMIHFYAVSYDVDVSVMCACELHE